MTKKEEFKMEHVRGVPVLFATGHGAGLRVSLKRFKGAEAIKLGPQTDVGKLVGAMEGIRPGSSEAAKLVDQIGAVVDKANRKRERLNHAEGVLAQAKQLLSNVTREREILTDAIEEARATIERYEPLLPDVERRLEAAQKEFDSAMKTRSEIKNA